jgi:hypothetical protein
MVVYPELDGTLRVDLPTAETRYDLGNHQLYVTIDGAGNTRRLLLVEGVDAGGWQIEVHCQGRSIAFQHGRAVGNHWELIGEFQRLRVTFSTVLPQREAAVLQRITVQNADAYPVRLGVTVRIHLPEQRQTQPFPGKVVTHVPQVWARGAAKWAQPAAIGPAREEGTGVIQATSPRLSTWGSLTTPERVTRKDGHIVLTFWLDIPADGQAEWHWGFCAGTAEQLRAMLSAVPRFLAEVEEARSALLQRLPSQCDPLQRSMVLACCHAALANFKRFAEGFAGFLAGVEYSYPPRLYFRDGYWTAQVALRVRPDFVRQHLLSLACGVHDDGQCPSGVFVPSCLPFPAQKPADLDWLPDHLDSPALFILLVRDYVRETGDRALLREEIPYPFQPAGSALRHVWAALQAAGQYLLSRDRNNDGVVEKPYRANDWCDNIRRSTWVTYDQALFAAALLALAELAQLLGRSREADDWRHKGERAVSALNNRLWNHEQGHYLDYQRRNFTETHMALDTLVAAYFDLVPAPQLPSLLRQAKQLLTKYNYSQPFGDWGVLNVYPLYQRRRDLFGKSAQPYHYHNGADWPYLDGVFGTVALRHYDDDAEYILTRWWSYSLAHGWLTPIEYYSPAYPPGGMLQAWSAMPALPFLSSGRNEGLC